MNLQNMTDKDLVSWVYAHPIAGGCGGDVNIPEPSEEEKELTRLQVEAMRSQAQMTEALMPYMLSELDLEKVVNPETGEIEFRSIRDPQDERLEQQSRDIQEAANVRVLSAQKGELEIDPSVEADIERGMSQLREELYRKLGPGSEGSDAWNRAIAEYNRGSNSLRYGIRHGEMTTADAISANRENQLQRRQAQQFTQLQSAPNPYVVSADMLGSGIQPYRNERYRQADLKQRNKEMRAQMIGSAIQGGASAAGAAYGAQ